MFNSRSRFLFGVALVVTALASARGASWESTVSPVIPGRFPEARPVTVKYGFGWNGITAATADIRFTRPTNNQFRFKATGGTIGLARALWNYRINHVANIDAATLRPLDIKEVEQIRSKQVTTQLTFTPDGVTSVREQRKGSAVSSKTHQFQFPDVLSINSALLYLRTQPLVDGEVKRVVVYPANSAYLCTVTVIGRERITVPTDSYDAIKADVQLNKIGRERELLPHKKFRKATVWLSNDSARIVLRIEAQVFIGTVFAELQSMQVQNATP